MKIIVAGGRDIVDYRPVMLAIKEASHLPVPIVMTELVCGMATGVDLTGYYFAKMARLPIEEFPADWDTHGMKAGPIRNQQMADYADALIAVWDGKSPGTKDMISRMQKKTNLVHVYRV